MKKLSKDEFEKIIRVISKDEIYGYYRIKDIVVSKNKGYCYIHLSILTSLLWLPYSSLDRLIMFDVSQYKVIDEFRFDTNMIIEDISFLASDEKHLLLTCSEPNQLLFNTLVYKIDLENGEIRFLCQTEDFEVKPQSKVKDVITIQTYPIYQTYTRKNNKNQSVFAQDGAKKQKCFYIRLKIYQNQYSNFILNIERKVIKFIDNRPLVGELLFAFDKYNKYLFSFYQQTKKLKVEQFDFNMQTGEGKLKGAFSMNGDLPEAVKFEELCILPQLRNLSHFGRCMHVQVKKRTTDRDSIMTVLFSE